MSHDPSDSPVDQPGDQTGDTESDPGGAGPAGLSGGMGVSSERVGRVRGSDVPATHGAADTASPREDDRPPVEATDRTT